MKHLVPYIPQLITALATLAGVVLTLLFTGRREAKRTAQQLDWEREKWTVEERRLIRSMTFSAKQAAFSEFTGAYHDAINAKWNRVRHPEDGAYPEELRAAMDNLALARDQLSLFDSQVIVGAEWLVEQLIHLDNGVESDLFWDIVEPYNDRLGELLDEMRVSLASIEGSPLNSRTQPKLTGTPKSGDSNKH